MDYRVRIREEAKHDLLDAKEYYENQQVGLGLRFIHNVDSPVKRIISNPMQYPVVYRSLHKALVSQFSYCIFYIVENVTITIVAILHSSRHPSNWKGRS